MFSIKDYTRTADVISYAGMKILSENEIKSLQNIMLDILKDIMKVADKYDFHPIMAGGSALGVVRHKGFIPWDDDIDMVIPRKECVAFIKAFEKEFSDKYIISSPYGISQFVTPTIHIIARNTKLVSLWSNKRIRPFGVAIDIVPLDYAPTNKLLYYIHGIISCILLLVMNSKLMYMSRTKISDKLFAINCKSRFFYFYRLSIGFIFSFISYNHFVKLYDKWISLCKESKLITIPAGRKHYFGETQPVDVFVPPLNAEFENIQVYIPKEYKTYLKRIYGDDYMQIPPINKREIHACVSFETSV